MAVLLLLTGGRRADGFAAQQPNPVHGLPPSQKELQHAPARGGSYRLAADVRREVRPSQARQNWAIACGSPRAAARAWKISGAGGLNRAARRFASYSSIVAWLRRRS